MEAAGSVIPIADLCKIHLLANRDTNLQKTNKKLGHKNN